MIAVVEGQPLPITGLWDNSNGEAVIHTACRAGDGVNTIPGMLQALGSRRELRYEIHYNQHCRVFLGRLERADLNCSEGNRIDVELTFQRSAEIGSAPYPTNPYPTNRPNPRVLSWEDVRVLNHPDIMKYADGASRITEVWISLWGGRRGGMVRTYTEPAESIAIQPMWITDHAPLGAALVTIGGVEVPQFFQNSEAASLALPLAEMDRWEDI